MIRPATPDDAPALGAIWNRVIRETTSIFNTTERGEAEIARSSAIAIRSLSGTSPASRVLPAGSRFAAMTAIATPSNTRSCSHPACMGAVRGGC